MDEDLRSRLRLRGAASAGALLVREAQLRPDAWKTVEEEDEHNKKLLNLFSSSSS